MIGIIQKKIGVKIAIIVNIVLLCILAAGSFFIYSQQVKQYESQLLEKGRLASMLGAKCISRILEEAVDNGVMPLKDVQDDQYEEIPGFDPPKYHTKYDWYTDKALLSFQDEMLKQHDILYAVAQDVNGYIPTHNTRYNNPITGDKQKDLVGNRTKRIFSDPVGKRAGENETEGFMQVYPRDTGETIWDISSPIYVKGHHWGGFRLGFELNTIAAAKKKLLISFLTIIGITFFISMIVTFIVINSALEPLANFTRLASDLADGNVDAKITASSQNEIGQLADVLERLRISLKAAMDRLSQKR